MPRLFVDKKVLHWINNLPSLDSECINSKLEELENLPQTGTLCKNMMIGSHFELREISFPVEKQERTVTYQFVYSFDLEEQEIRVLESRENDLKQSSDQKKEEPFIFS